MISKYVMNIITMTTQVEGRLTYENTHTHSTHWFVLWFLYLVTGYTMTLNFPC